MELCFKHRAGWHEDQKLVNLIVETGYEGYGVYSVLLELLVSQGGSLELNYKKLNHTVRCSTELLKRVITEFDLFAVVADERGSVCFYAEWLLEDIRRAEKTSKARSASGKKGRLCRQGLKKASEHANAVGVPNNERQEKSDTKQAIATANATTNAIANATTNAIANAHTHARIGVDITDDRRSSRNAHENFSKSSKTEDEGSWRKPLAEHIPLLRNDTEWQISIVTALASNGVAITEKQVTELFDGFCQEKMARGEHTSLKTLTEAKAWFFNWLLFKIEKMKRNGNDKPRVATGGGGAALTTTTGHSGGSRKSFAEQVRESKERLVRDTIEMLQNGKL